MVAVANACDLEVPHDGLGFPPCGAEALATVLRRKALGGVLERDGMVEVVSSLQRDGRPVDRDLRWGVYVVLKAANEYAAACFGQYGLPTDASGRYAAMYKPYHLIGLELSISVLNAALRGEPTGCCRAWRGDAVAVAKRALKAGEMLDGEGGYTVYSKLIPAAKSIELGGLPIRAGASRQTDARCARRRDFDGVRCCARRRPGSRPHPRRDGTASAPSRSAVAAE